MRWCCVCISLICRRVCVGIFSFGYFIRLPDSSDCVATAFSMPGHSLVAMMDEIETQGKGMMINARIFFLIKIDDLWRGGI